MIDVDEAKIRIALAEIEARRVEDRSRKSSARWRLGFMIAWTLAVLALGYFAQKSKLDFSGSGWIGLIGTSLLAAGWWQYRVSEELRDLRAEVAQMRQRICDKTDGR